MKRDIKLNMGNLRLIQNKIYNYIDELQRIENASARFMESIENQDSQAYDRLWSLWDENVTKNECDLKEKLEIIYEILNNYIADMESYIAPQDSYAMMRVDRNDIWWNYEQIAGIPVSNSIEDIIWDTGSSWVDYHNWFVYNPWEDEASNNARKVYLQDEENAERTRRENNYNQLADFRNRLLMMNTETFGNAVTAIRNVYDNNIVSFENTDDDYKKKLDDYYDTWATAGDRFYDVCSVVGEVLRGAVDAVIDFLVGTAGLLVGLIELSIYQEMHWKPWDRICLIPQMKMGWRTLSVMESLI